MIYFWLLLYFLASTALLIAIMAVFAQLLRLLVRLPRLLRALLGSLFYTAVAITLLVLPIWGLGFFWSLGKPADGAAKFAAFMACLASSWVAGLFFHRRYGAELRNLGYFRSPPQS